MSLAQTILAAVSRILSLMTMAMVNRLITNRDNSHLHCRIITQLRSCRCHYPQDTNSTQSTTIQPHLLHQRKRRSLMRGYVQLNLSNHLKGNLQGGGGGGITPKTLHACALTCPCLYLEPSHFSFLDHPACNHTLCNIVAVKYCHPFNHYSAKARVIT